MYERLSEYTSFGIGGGADVYFLRDHDDAELLSRPHVILGRGTNVLVSDRGCALPVVVNRLRGVRFDGCEAWAASGEPLASLARECAARSLSGLEWACGIPGSVGGAVAMNAGAFGGSVAARLVYADVLVGGSAVRLSAAECGFGYRSSKLRGFVLGAAFALDRAESALVEARMRELDRRRALTQPKGRSAGSVYKRADLPAGAYIEGAGLKGAREGGAVVSEKHANFILNAGGATAADVLRLMERIEAAVYARYGVKLEREIKLIGEF